MSNTDFFSLVLLALSPPSLLPLSLPTFLRTQLARDAEGYKQREMEAIQLANEIESRTMVRLPPTLCVPVLIILKIGTLWDHKFCPLRRLKHIERFFSIVSLIWSVLYQRFQCASGRSSPAAQLHNCILSSPSLSLSQHSRHGVDDLGSEEDRYEVFLSCIHTVQSLLGAHLAHFSHSHKMKN